MKTITVKSDRANHQVIQLKKTILKVFFNRALSPKEGMELIH